MKSVFPKIAQTVRRLLGKFHTMTMYGFLNITNFEISAFMAHE